MQMLRRLRANSRVISLQSIATQSIVKSVLALLSGTAIARLLSAATLVLIARQVGPAQFGRYAATLAIVRISAALFSLGLDGWLLRNGYRSGDNDHLSENFISCLSIKGVGGIVWFGGLWVLSLFLNPDTFPPSIIALCAVTVWFEGLASTVWTAFKAKLQNRTTLFLLTFFSALPLLPTLLLMWADVTLLSPYLIWRAAMAAIGCGISLFVLFRHFSFAFSPKRLRITLTEIGPFAASLMLALLYERADLAIIGHWLGKAQAGLYAPAATILTALFLIPASLFGVGLPFFSKKHAAGELKFAQTWPLFLGSFAFGALLTGAVGIAGPPLIRSLYGLEYQQAATILLILSPILLLRCSSYIAAALIVAIGWQKWRVLVQAVAAAFNIVLNILMVRQRGITGVAWIYVCTELLLFVGYMALVLLWQQRTGRRETPSTPQGSTA